LRAAPRCGAHWLSEPALLQFLEAASMVDWYRLSEKVPAAADAVLGEARDEASQGAEARLSDV